MRTKDIATALYYSAHGAAHLDTEVSKNVPYYVSPLDGLRAAAPHTTDTSVVWTSHAVLLAQVGRNCGGCSFHRHSAGNPLQFTLIYDKGLVALLHTNKGRWVEVNDIKRHV